MTDQELRTALLRQLYDQRSSRDWVQIGSDARVQSSEGHEQIRIAKQLADAGYVEFKMLNLNVGGMARITGPGADVVESVTHRSTGVTVNVSNSSNVQIGQGNI